MGLLLGGDLKAASSFQVGKHLDDVFRYRWWGRQVSPTGSETVLIRRPVNSHHGNSVGMNVRVRSAGYCTDVFRQWSDSLLETTFLNLGTIFTLIAI